ncbi:Pr6Pr family membrane protein [Microbacterium ulmi]|uniref:Pr6Pr family membrane protein n=1 Tax=Microbacterium ulmi TaxID=179095 RepID=A0A7Y2M1S3_9MICO|nr:Pr6Pr family membrane protein [Microbacterium ulmi]NII69493.1 hypothetical protein [Microbacterium ulmi]NNH04906.1 Pr6Pr family membrane protein [Microbacterium ulmi]
MTRTRWWGHVWSFLRVAMAGAAGAAVVAQAAETIGGAAARGRDAATVAANFVSFFTIESNILMALVLVWAAVWFWTRGRGSASEPRLLAFALVCVTTYMLVTGVVYNALLRGIPLEPGATVPWSNEVLHVVGPAFMLADLLLGPKRRALPWAALWGVLVFPVAWVVYTLARAPRITNPVTGEAWWYPYPFLDPHRFVLDYLGVAAYVVGIALAIAAIAAIVVWVGRWRGVRRVRSAPETSALAPAG